MRFLTWTALVFAVCAQAQSSSTLLVPDTVTVSPTSTSTRPTVTSIVTVSVSSTLTVTSTSTFTTTVTSTSTLISTSTTTSASTSTASSTSISSSSSSSTSSSTTSSSAPVVTDEAYIDTILRHHNRHRSNHSANALTWSAGLASTAKKIADSCIYQHNTTADGGGYGQNIAAGFYPTQMGSMVSDGFYNTEVNSYTYYGGEPDYNTVSAWGHFTQIVWKETTAVGCYTTNCTAQGLVFPTGGGANVPPYFSVCNYSPAGNVVGSFGANVGSPLGFATITAGYECPTTENCVGPTT